MENVMKQEELLKYMKDAIEVETDLATQEQMLERSLEEIENRKPTLKLYSDPQRPTLETSQCTYSLAGLCFLAGFLFFVILCGHHFGVALLIGSIWMIPGIFIVMRAKKIEEINSGRLNEHNTKVQAIKEKNKQETKKHNNIIKQCDNSCIVLREATQPHINQTKELLDKLYDKNIIYPKYCTLPALTSIYEYFMTGRCTELTGPHGAYNLYEDELRKDTVISQLNTVIENLEQIRHNQYMLYQQVKSINENTNTIVSELQQIKDYTIRLTQLTALNAYYAALNERNTRVTMYYHL